eukprot:GGOE01055970.1.p1 GENE.GGOE01055970.1~~GGOE01055970.1.p1  ORF type:complete len:284 (-),score=49.99 GGOE01055970.1:301-1047(-)
MVRIAQETNLAHLVDQAKFPEFAELLVGSDELPTLETLAHSHTPPTPQVANLPQTTDSSIVVDGDGITSGTLAFQFTGDQGGLVNFIATNQGSEEWTNPVQSGLIKVEASSIKKGFPFNVVDAQFNHQVFFTDNIPYSWVSIDFGNYRIKPTHYSFAHRAGNPQLGYFMRNWELHASNDGETWVVVRKHVNDTAINATALMASWQIEDVGLEHYRYFRVVIDPSGNSNHTSALVVSCFEIYGDWKFLL